MKKTLKEALRETIVNGAMPMRRLHDHLGISYSYLANAANPNLDDFHFQLRHVIPLINATGNYAVLDFLENACGRVAYTLPETTKDRVEITAGLLDLFAKVGELSQQMRAILTDGLIESSEYKSIEPVFFGLLREVARLMSSAAQAVKG